MYLSLLIYKRNEEYFRECTRRPIKQWCSYSDHLCKGIFIKNFSSENKKMETVTKVMDPGGGLKTLHPLLCSVSQVLGLWVSPLQTTSSFHFSKWDDCKLLKWGPTLPTPAVLAHVHSGPRSTSREILRKNSLQGFQNHPERQPVCYPSWN